ncbi:MAG: Crp/Fnr family transcriptional regulator [Zoogloeaceae bacterium]|nr:Crp/Fnr family transcriptional regulator [Zoogloeaceae bacterium]
MLRNLPEDLLRFIAGHVKECQLRDREFLFLQGDPGDFVGFVVNGMVYHQMFSPDGRELTAGCSATGEIVGLSALSSTSPRQIAARASGTTRVLTISKRHFLVLLRERVFLEELVAWLSDLCEKNLDFIETACLYPLEARLARHILRNLKEGAVPCLRLPAHQGMLAAMINASRSKLNVRLQSWKAMGLIHVRGNQFFIDDLPQIRHLACLPN